MRSPASRIVVAALLSFAASLAHAQTLYAITGAGCCGTPSLLYIVDPLTGSTSLVGPTGFDDVTAMDFDPTTGNLYGVVSNDSGTGPLILINRTTGVGTFIGVVGEQIPDITIGADGIIRGWEETGSVSRSTSSPAH